jgi:hypothetical protein
MQSLTAERTIENINPVQSFGVERASAGSFAEGRKLTQVAPLRPPAGRGSVDNALYADVKTIELIARPQQRQYADQTEAWLGTLDRAVGTHAEDL